MKECRRSTHLPSIDEVGAVEAPEVTKFRRNVNLNDSVNTQLSVQVRLSINTASLWVWSYHNIVCGNERSVAMPASAKKEPITWVWLLAVYRDRDRRFNSRLIIFRFTTHAWSKRSLHFLAQSIHNHHRIQAPSSFFGSWSQQIALALTQSPNHAHSISPSLVHTVQPLFSFLGSRSQQIALFLAQSPIAQSHPL